MEHQKDSITVPELKVLLQHILEKAYIKETKTYYGNSDGSIISDINWSSTGKEEYKNFIEAIVDAVSIISDSI